ncbi:flagellar hook-length control protein FliK [Massilia putida]|uniref:flagellar hook-length control protein FliK n=1 Tax=Massilia putida TaxID=1141883 RepID=UPI000951076D|nr:flagellar hook-length control protein FliK [Massilia putida]
MMLNTVSPSAPAQSDQQANAPAAVKDAAPAPATPSAQTDGAAPAPAQTFARWLGQQLDGAGPVLQAAVPVTQEADDDSAPPSSATAAPAGDKSTDDGKAAAAVPDSALLAAMAMPLMPLSPQQVTQAVQAAQGNPQGTTRGTDDAGKAETPAQPLAVSGQDGRRAAIALPQALQAAQAAQPEATATNVRLAVQGNAANGNAGTSSQDANADGSASQNVQAGTNTAPAAAVPGAVPLPAAQPAADTVKLAGPPTAWRQTLQETLGDRLNVHVAGNVQQATISIEPPQLGRIDIAIRHSAGTLEVNISASNGDVLRQLQTVSDNLRNDLSQRQYTEVAVTVTPAPKNSAAPFGDPQQQGRGRQRGRDQDNEPGRGLAEAGNPASVFNLGRDS